MPRYTTFRPYELSKFDRKKQTLGITQFLGADFNPAQLQVATNHATDILNLIYKDRVNQKRNGWEQLYKVSPFVYYIENSDGTMTMKTNGTSFNGIWEFIGEDNIKHTIAHIGNLLFIVNNLDNKHTFLDIKMSALCKQVVVGGQVRNVALELLDHKSQAFIGDKRLYILGGNKFYVIKANTNIITMAEVEDDEDTYIPTTTIGITYADSKVTGQSALDDVNMMTQYRKNKLVSGTYYDDGVSLRTTRFWDFQLDTNIKPKVKTDINNIKIKINSLKEVEQ